MSTTSALRALDAEDDDVADAGFDEGSLGPVQAAVQSTSFSSDEIEIRVFFK